jgi:hypothetical protein
MAAPQPQEGCGDQQCQAERNTAPELLPNGLRRVITARLNPQPNLHLNIAMGQH